MTQPITRRKALVLVGAGAAGLLHPRLSAAADERHGRPGELVFTAGPEHWFHTQRAPGRTFTFEIQGDSHPERPQMFDPMLYAQTLCAAAADRPDVYMTIGDDFSVDTLRAIDAEAVHQIYLR